MLFIETTTPPPFYQQHLSAAERTQLDKWFIGKRSQAYYLKRFAQFDKQGYLSPKWHWAAFFMTFGWLLYRKRYMDAIVYSVAGWSFIQLNVTIILVMFEYLAMPFIAESLQMPIRLGIAAAIWIFWSFMVARWSDAYYYRMARREIADAIEMYPRQPEAQKAHLEHEGGVSQYGLGLALGMFAFALFVIQVQFLPLYEQPKAKALIYEVYNITKGAKTRVELIYQQTGSCPVGLPLTTDDQKVHLYVTTKAEGIPASTCMVVATVQNVPFPNRYLNGQTMIMYRIADTDTNNINDAIGDTVNSEKVVSELEDKVSGSDVTKTTAIEKAPAQWGCISSLNKKQIPKGCIDN